MAGFKAELEREEAAVVVAVTVKTTTEPPAFSAPSPEATPAARVLLTIAGRDTATRVLRAVARCGPFARGPRTIAAAAAAAGWGPRYG